jgi:dUTP pyrophosphatase
MSIPLLKIRGFEICRGYEDMDVRLPEPATEHSAGYDFFAYEDITVPASTFLAVSPPFLVSTGVKAYMRSDEMLMLCNRSSNPNKGLMVANGIGIIDADYYENEGNDGHIKFPFWNLSMQPVTIKRGERIGQGIFYHFLRADNPMKARKRVGGFGSTDNV